MEVDAFIFDLHHTITETSTDFTTLVIDVAEKVGISLREYDRSELQAALLVADKFMKGLQVKNNVDIHWGTKPEHWLEVNRTLFNELGIDSLTDDKLINFEREWKDTAFNSNAEFPFEWLTEDGRRTLVELHQMKYKVGVCTRRHDDPVPLLMKSGIFNLLSSVQWTGVPGYAKPSPYTLIIAASEMNVNPKRCAFVGNDVNADIIAAQRAEMIPILVTWANPDEEKIAPADVLILESPINIIDHLRH